MGNRIGKFLACTLSVGLSLNATALALNTKLSPELPKKKQKISSGIKKKDSKSIPREILGTSLAVGGAICLCIERLATGKWFPLVRACIPHHRSYNRDVLVVSYDENARNKFMKNVFDRQFSCGRECGTFTYMHTIVGTKSCTLPIFFTVPDSMRNVESAGELDGNGHIKPAKANFLKGTKCILVTVDGDQGTDKVKAHIDAALDYVVPARDPDSRVIVAICNDEPHDPVTDKDRASVKSYLSHKESYFLRQVMGTGPERNGQFLDYNVTLSSSDADKTSLMEMVDVTYIAIASKV